MASSRFTVLAVVLCALLAFGSAAMAETMYVKTVNHTDPMVVMGQQQAAQDDTTETWFSEKAIYMDDGKKGGMLASLDDGAVYLINHEKKTYFKIPMGLLGASEESLAEVPANPMAAMLGDVTYTVTPVDETKKIGDWDTKRYDASLSMAVGNTKTTMWVAEGIDFKPELYYPLLNASMSFLDQYEDIVKEMKKIDGFPVYSTTEATMMGTTIKGSQSVLEVAKKDAPEGTFSLPEGYTATTTHPVLQPGAWPRPGGGTVRDAAATAMSYRRGDTTLWKTGRYILPVFLSGSSQAGSMSKGHP